ncbi:MAG: ribonuclease PH [Chloroflexi bacterium]|nr:ribonuclease PH [Chloroflexota bacterium]
MSRIDGREPNELRPVRITPNFLTYAEGSALIEQGQTRVLCAASVEDRVPGWMRGTKRGWVTAEYAMLPRSTLQRTPREQAQGRATGRSLEIQRLIGRSLRAVTDLASLDERSLVVDCDVLQADGGTRTAAVTGAYVALRLALERLRRQGAFPRLPLREPVAAVSVGILGEELLLDLCYEEDSQADADFNVVMTASGALVEVQGTAEKQPYSRARLQEVLDLAESGIRQLVRAQEEALAAASG